MQIQKTKPGYKLVKSFFRKYEEIPENWNINSLDEVTKITRLAGYEYSTVWKHDPNGKIIALRGYNIQKNLLDLKDVETITEELSNQLFRSKLFRNDVVFPCVGSIGKAALILEDNKFHINQNIAKITPGNVLDSLYLTYFLMGEYTVKQIFKYNASTSQPNVLVGNLRKFYIFIPPVKVQQKITSILSNVDSLIQQYNSIIESTKKLKKGLMQQLLTKGIGHTKFKEINFHFGKIINIPEIWKLGKLREYTLKIGSGITPKGGSKIYKTTGIPLIRSQNVQFDGLKLDDVALISKEIHEKMKNTKLDVHDVLLNITGASIGRCTYVPDHLKEGNVNQHVCILRPKKDVDYRFLTHFLSTKFMQDIINSSQAGLSRQGLNFEEIGNYLIPIPHIGEQKEIAFILNNMSSRISSLESKQASLQILKKGLMQKLLTGQLRV